jgi:hypothetical protein
MGRVGERAVAPIDLGLQRVANRADVEVAAARRLSVIAARPRRVVGPALVSGTILDRHHDQRRDLSATDQVLADAIEVDTSLHVEHRLPIVHVEHRIAAAVAAIARRQVHPADPAVAEGGRRELLDVPREEPPGAVVGTGRLRAAGEEQRDRDCGQGGSEPSSRHGGTSP